ncbi:hypothetical protein [Halovulum dunhuangense]|nr:hypothetical protein [Halovulum dunhuangense]
MMRQILDMERPAALMLLGDAIGLAAICVILTVGLALPGIVF